MNAQGQPDEKDLFLFQTGCRQLEKCRNNLTAAGLAFEGTPVASPLRLLMRDLLKAEKEATTLRKGVEVATAAQLELVTDD